jgi:hypothetical protein
MAGLVPAIHVFGTEGIQAVDARHRRAKATPFCERQSAGMTIRFKQGQIGYRSWI